jgi:hypothetical protein
VSHTEIDEVNILQATMNGMRRSTEALHAKLQKLHPNGAFRALIDGNRVPADMPVDATYVIKGDSLIFSIAAASIIAKVTRDRLMLELDKEFPVYNFAQHKGYPTFAHRSLLMQHGPCRVHRTSYAPVKLAMAAHGITDLTTLPSPAATVAAVAVKTAVPKATAKKATTKAVKASKVKVSLTKPSKTEKAGSKASIAKKGATDTTEKVVKAAASVATAVSARAGRRASSQSVDSLALLPARATRVEPAARSKSNGALKKSPSASNKTAKKSTTVSLPKVRRSAKAKDIPGDVVEDSVVGGVGKGKRSKAAPAEVPAEVKEGSKRKAAPALDKKRKAVSKQDGENSAGARKSARLRQ